MTKKKSALLLIIILIVSSGLTTIFFKPGDILSPEPIYSDDYSMHLSNCYAAKQFWLSSGRGWGYDPFLLAGFPRCTLVDADNKAWELFFMAMSPVFGPGLAFKLYVLVFLIFYPLVVYAAARNFRLSRQESLIASVLSILFFNLSLPHDLVLWGMVSYVIACFFSIYLISLYYRMYDQFSSRRYIAVVACSAIILLIHILGLMHVVVPTVALYFLYARRLSLKQHLLILLIPILILAINSFWLIPIFELFQDKTTRPENYEFTLQIKNIFEPLIVYLKQQRSQAPGAEALNTTFFEIMLLLFGCSGIYYWYTQKNRKLALAFILGIVYIFCINFYGSHTPFFAQFQPQRFTIGLNILLLIPAAIGVLMTGRLLFYKKKPMTIVFALILLFAILYRPVIRPFAIMYRYGLYRLNCEVPEPIKQLITVFENSTTRQGRILLEDSESRHDENGTYYPEAYYGTHYPGLFPKHVKREFLCGPRPMYPVKHSYASFTRGILFEKTLVEYTPAELNKYFNLYNVKWIVCWLQTSKKFFEQFPDYITKIRDIDKFTLYEVQRNPSFFIKGSGTVHSDYNRLELSNIIPVGGEIIIAYHWMKHLKTEPPTSMSKIMIGEDPVGFIKLINPPESIVITNKY